MKGRLDQRDYWSHVAATKRFSHPVRLETLERYLRRDAPLLDLGCGYGRTTSQLWVGGWRGVVGADTAPGMIAEGRSRFPHLDLRCIEPGRLPFSDGAFEAVLLLAVLTCIPRDDDLEELMREVERVLRPGGVLFLSDLFVQTDDRNEQRYREGLESFGTWGIFSLPEGGVFRHFTREKIDELTNAFDPIEFEEMEVTTMNGHAARGFRLIARTAAESTARSGRRSS